MMQQSLAMQDFASQRVIFVQASKMLPNLNYRFPP
jgi:hypothetical protein